LEDFSSKEEKFEQWRYNRTGNMDFDRQSINFYDEYTIHVYKFLGIS